MDRVRPITSGRIVADPIQEALERAASADDVETLFKHLEPLGEHLTHDIRVAHIWAQALRTSPRRATLESEADAMLEAFPYDGPLVITVGAALLRRAERRSFDEPPEDDGAAAAAGAATRCLARADEPELVARLHALHGNALGLLGPKRTPDAVAALERAIAAAPESADHRADLARLHKYGRDFPSSLSAARDAVSLAPGHRGARWNVAIAATATGASAEAAEAWKKLGIEATVREGALPFVDGLEPIRVRLPTLGPGRERTLVPNEAASFELVWVQPLSPCHGVVRSPTVREAIADFGDTILWDGNPVAVQTIDERPVPTMPLLAVLRKGSEARHAFLALEQKAGQIEAIAAGLPDGLTLLQQGLRVEVVCPRCAAGDRLTKHEHLPAEAHRIAFGKLIIASRQGAPSNRLREAATKLDEARKKQPGVLMAIPSLYESIGDTPEAGKHHKRWGVIERTKASDGSGS